MTRLNAERAQSHVNKTLALFTTSAGEKWLTEGVGIYM